MLFDTDILIWAQRGSEKAARLIDRHDTRFVSVLTYMELLQGAPNKRQMNLNKRFIVDLNFTTLALTENIGHRAAIYLETYALKTGLRMADAIIAATASEAGLPLLTSNQRHYRAIKDLELVIFKP